MKNILKRVAFATFVISLSLTLSGWSLLGTSSKAKSLDDEVVQENKGNFEGLWNAWIKPQIELVDGEIWGIRFEEKEEKPPTEVAIGEDFARFCKESGGNAASEKMKYGNKFICSSLQGEFLGQFETERFARAISIRFDTPNRRAARKAALAEQQKYFDDLWGSNGPTGWVTTDKGRYQFVRIGTIQQRDVIEVNEIPIEQIKNITYSEKCCDIQIEKRDGAVLDSNSGYYRKRTAFNSIATFGVDGKPFVLIDVATGLTYQKIFDASGQSREQIRKIEIDDVQAWQGRPGGPLFDGGDYLKLASGSSSMDELRRLIARFENNDPNNLVPKARTRLASLISEEQARQEANARQQATEVAARRKRLENKQVGDQVCFEATSTMKQSTGYIVMGEPQYRTLEGVTRLVGFVENINLAAKKIQIRISGINFTGGGITESLDSFSNFKGGSKLILNSVIWDGIYDWENC